MVKNVIRADELKISVKLDGNAFKETALRCLLLFLEDRLLFLARSTLQTLPGKKAEQERVEQERVERAELAKTTKDEVGQMSPNVQSLDMVRRSSQERMPTSPSRDLEGRYTQIDVGSVL
jgi:hypothetical protein